MVSRMSTTVTSNAAGWRRLAIIAITVSAMVSAVWLLTGLTAPTASAHAAYVSSSPAFAEVLSESPSEISIRFTQELFRRAGANEMWVEPARGDDIPQYPLQVEINNDDRHVMRGTMDRELAPGRYLVRWRNLSAEDGDEDRGVFPFYVQSDPKDAEVGYDREIAAALLIAYPNDDEPQDTVEAAAPAVVNVVRSDGSADVRIGAGAIIWLIAGPTAAALLMVSWRRRHQRQRRSAT